MAVTVVCADCGAKFTAQRRTRKYCSEACRQRAKRAREWAVQWDYLPFEARCAHCGGPLFPDNPSKALKGNPEWTHRRKYCSRECRNAARRFRYRVALADGDSPYRVTDPASDPYALAEPVPCWRSAEWHEMARAVLTLMEQGFVLDHPEKGVVGLALVREFAARQTPVRYRGRAPER